MKIARHRGMKKAIVALTRRLAVIMHRIWIDGTEFRWTREADVIAHGNGVTDHAPSFVHFRLRNATISAPPQMNSDLFRQ
jgi:hypothetical protein